MNYNREKVIKIIRKIYAVYRGRHLVDILVIILSDYLRHKSTQDEWNESEHPRRENGQFGKGGGSSKKSKPSKRHNRVKNRQRKPLNMSNTEKAVLRDAVARNQFNDEEKESGYATRYTSQYSYLVKIDNAGLLSYTPISRIKIQ